MSKVPTDDVLKNLYKWRIHESDQLKTVSETHEIEIHQKMSKPEYWRLKNYGEENFRTKDQVRKLSGQKREERNRSSVQESEGEVRW